MQPDHVLGPCELVYPSTFWVISVIAGPSATGAPALHAPDWADIQRCCCDASRTTARRALDCDQRLPASPDPLRDRSATDRPSRETSARHSRPDAGPGQNRHASRVVDPSSELRQGSLVGRGDHCALSSSCARATFASRAATVPLTGSRLTLSSASSYHFFHAAMTAVSVAWPPRDRSHRDERRRPACARAPAARRRTLPAVAARCGVVLVCRRQQPRARRDGHADVDHLRRAGLVRPIEVRVVVAIGEVPVEQRRHAGVAERGVIAAAFVRIGPHDPVRSFARAAGRPRGARRSTGCPSAIRALTWLAPHSVCGSDGRAQTADGSACFSIRNVPPVFVVSSPVMSSENMYWTPFACAGCGVEPLRLPRISSTQMNVSVRPGALQARVAASPAPARRASAIQRPAPAPIVVRAGLLDVRHHDDALVRLHGPGNLGDERAVRPVVERRLDVDLDLHRARSSAARACAPRRASSP